MNPLIRRHGYAFLVILVVACLSWWPVINGSNPLSHDQSIAFYPWRYFIGECLKEGLFPYWNPYQAFGYPMHADPQAGTWYLPVWLLGLNGYSMYDLNLEFSLHLLLSGMGMYFFSGLFIRRPELRMASGIAYMCSGFMVGNAQHLSWVIAATWLPWIPYTWFRYVQQGKSLHLLTGICAVAFMLTGGYPMFAITLAYGMAMVLFYVLIRWRKTLQIPPLMVLKRSLFIAMPALLMACGTLLSMVLALPSFSRVKGVDLDACLFGSFDIKAWSSFFLPLASRDFADFFGNDPSMCNAYFGALLVSVLPLSFFIKQRKTALSLSAAGVFFLLLAAGQDVSLRTWFFDHVPLFNVSRFPALFRCFALLMLVPASALVMESLFTGANMPRKWITAFALSYILLLLASFMLVSPGMQDFLGTSSMLQTLHRLSLEKNFTSLVYANLILQIVFLLSYFFTLVFIRSVRIRIAVLLLLFASDLIMMTRSNGPVNSWTLVSENKDLNAFMEALPEGFPVPAPASLNQYNDSSGFYGVLWRNVNNYRKQPAWDGFSSSFFPGAAGLADSCSDAFRTYRLERFWTQWFPESPAKGTAHSQWCNNHLKSGRFQLGEQIYSYSDSAIKGAELFPVCFNPESVKILVTSTRPGIVMLAQNLYPGWHAYLNKKEIPLYPFDRHFLSAKIPAGQHEVAFRYHHPLLTASLHVQAWSSLLVLAALGYLLLFNRLDE